MKLEERALFGLPIETRFGEVKPLSVYDYMSCNAFLTAMSFDKKRVLHEIRLSQPENVRDTKETTEELKALHKEYSLREIILSKAQPYFSAYAEILSRCMFFHIEEQKKRQESAYTYLLEISNEDFDELRKILLKINGQSEQTAFLNPLMQKKKEQALKFHAKDSEDAPDVSTIVTSIVTYTGLDYQEVLQWNVTQLLQAFQRIQMFQNYATTTMFATVAGDKVDIIEWSKNIEIKDDSNTDSSFAVELDQFKNKVGNQLGN